MVAGYARRACADPDAHTVGQNRAAYHPHFAVIGAVIGRAAAARMAGRRAPVMTQVWVQPKPVEAAS